MKKETAQVYCLFFAGFQIPFVITLDQFTRVVFPREIIHNGIMVFVSFIIGLLVYSFVFIDLIVLSALWKKTRDSGILWTIILMGAFICLLIFQLFNDFLKGIDISWDGISILLDGMQITAGLSALFLVYAVPRFSVAMNGHEKWKGWLPKVVMAICFVLGCLYLLFFFKGPRFRELSYTLIFSTLILSLIITLSINIYNSRKDTASGKVALWYVAIAISMARWALYLLPLFFILDFYPKPYPWPWLNRIADHFSAVPVLCLIWNIRLLRGAFKEIFRLQNHGHPEGNLEDWFAENGLTDREREVVRLLLDGDSYDEICEKLFLSKATVKSHTNKIYRKTGLKNRVGLLKEAGPLAK